jgi:hypothetical protein
MKRWCLVTLTLMVLGVTYLVLTQLGWFRPQAQAATVAPTSQDPMLTSQGTRWRHSEPHHWRAYVLKQ